MKKLFTIAIAIVVMGAFTSCKKCGHCETSAGSTGTYCGKPDYDNAKKACESNGNLGGTAVGTWVDE